ncbi:MAG: alkaline phosphatase [Bacteroidales bacterium]
MRFKIFILLFAFSQAIFAGGPADKQKKTPKAPKNIILMIGDGMGTAQVYAALTAMKGKLNMARCPYSGFVKTNSADNYITDSGAGATAYATGKKTNNGYISISPEGNVLPTILETAEKHGLATGLVVTCAVTHATPAAFISHTPSRDKYDDIARDFLHTDIDVFIGGGRNNFNHRADSLNLLDSLAKNGYKVAGDLNDVDINKTQKLAALLAPVHLPKESEGRGDMLSKASTIALKILNRNKTGFFMMIEGSQIDWGGHDKNKDYVVSETVDFDNAVGIVLDFAEKNGETLVIITADHETGGMGLTGGNLATGEVEGSFIYGDHTGVMVPLFAFGPGAKQFSGLQENTDVNKKMSALLGFDK